MNQNDDIVGGNHKYLQISVNTDNVKEILLFLSREVTKQGKEISNLNNKFAEIPKSENISKLDEFCTETNKRLDEFNTTINSLLKSFTMKQESINNQIIKANDEIQKSVADKISFLERSITPFKPLLERIGNIQKLCDQMFSDGSTLDKIKEIKNIEDDVSKLKNKIKILEESQKNSNQTLMKQIELRKAGSFSARRSSATNKSNKDNITNSINNEDNNNHNSSNQNINEDKNNDNSSNNNNKNSNSNNINYNNNSMNQNNDSINNTNNSNKSINQKPKNEKSNSSQSNMKHECDNRLNSFGNDFNYDKPIQNNNISSSTSAGIDKGGPTANSVHFNDNSQSKTNIQPSKESKNKSDSSYDHLNSKKIRPEKLNATEKQSSSSNKDKTNSNNNSKASYVPPKNSSLFSGRQRHHFPTSSRISHTSKHQNQTDSQKNDNDYEYDTDEYDGDIANELGELKEILTLQSRQLSSLMEPDSLLLSAISKIVSEMLDERKSEISEQNDFKLQSIYGEMKRNIDAMRAQVDITNEKIENCATRTELVDVADKILNGNINERDGINTSIATTPMCYCLACGRPKTSVSTLSKMSKVNSHLFLDRSLHTILNYKPLSESTASKDPNQIQNTSRGARVKLLIGDKIRSSYSTPNVSPQAKTIKKSATIVDES